MGSRPSREELLAHPAFGALKRLVIERTGHFYYEDKDDLLAERLARRYAETGCRDTAAYIERLQNGFEGEAEWRALEAEITIGETFFFRYKEQFEALRTTILPNLIARKAESRRLRIWSAGCANGSEAYSVAIMLHRLLGEQIDGWRISILGTDINEAFLAKAKQASFNAWALRSLNAEERLQDFKPEPDGRHWTLRPRYRGMVRFERHNLMSLLDGTAPLQMTDFDLILCRNVLIYFQMTVVERLVAALGQRLAGGGWLLVGHAEANPNFTASLALVNLPGTVAYRRPGDGMADEGAESPPPAQPFGLASFTALPDMGTGMGMGMGTGTGFGIWPAIGAPVEMPRDRSDQASGKLPDAGFRPWPLPGVAPFDWTPLPVPEAPTPAAVPEPSAARAPTGAESGLLDTTTAEARTRADAGDIAGARLACAQGLALDPMSPSLHFLDGVIAMAEKRAAAAEAAFRRAIYLYKNFAMAHYHLGLLLVEDGRVAAGRRALVTAAGIAGQLADEAPLMEGDGLTAAGLRSVIRLTLDPPGKRHG